MVCNMTERYSNSYYCKGIIRTVMQYCSLVDKDMFTEYMVIVTIYDHDNSYVRIREQDVQAHISS